MMTNTFVGVLVNEFLIGHDQEHNKVERGRECISGHERQNNILRLEALVGGNCEGDDEHRVCHDGGECAVGGEVRAEGGVVQQGADVTAWGVGRQVECGRDGVLWGEKAEVVVEPERHCGSEGLDDRGGEHGPAEVVVDVQWDLLTKSNEVCE